MEFGIGIIWNDKLDKIKRTHLITNYKDGRLRIINLNMFIESLKKSSLKRFVSEMNFTSPSFFLLRDIFHMRANIDCYYFTEVDNHFWKELLLI